MIPRSLKWIAASAALVLGTGCELFLTNDAESVPGRGSTAFDPYAGARSGALKLSLQMFNGCALLASGEPVARGSLDIPYPSTCPDIRSALPTQPTIAPTAKLEIITGQRYFLNQLTLIDSVIGRHTDSKNLLAAADWFRTESRFKNLDWSNLGVVHDEFIASPIPNAWIRDVSYGNAEWMTARDDSFLLEVLDADGNVRESIIYSRGEFLAENAVSGHSRASWRIENLSAPNQPGEVRKLPGPFDPPILHRTILKMELMTSANPFKSFTVEGLSGEGALKVTWSLLPNEPFYFPVTYIPPERRAATCLHPDDGQTAVPCGFGLDPTATLSRPANGKFYARGETFTLDVQLRDAEGSLLHPPDRLPSYREFYANASNGILYYNPGHDNALMELDALSALQIAGPLHKLVPHNDPLEKRPFWQYSKSPTPLANEIAAFEEIYTLAESHWPTRTPVTIPEDAVPGTYVAILKANRQFHGERDSKTRAIFFQVGTEEETTYPNRVGNCQICHRGVLSMENVRHGMGVDHIEACKTCHDTDMSKQIHQLHMRSSRFSVQKNDCTTCHLTRESAVRPSLEACSSCHPSVHGVEYFSQQFITNDSPGRTSNCAQACHVTTTPTRHILPE